MKGYVLREKQRKKPKINTPAYPVPTIEVAAGVTVSEFFQIPFEITLALFKSP